MAPKTPEVKFPTIQPRQDPPELSSSWWLGLAPAEFKQKLQQELPRMQTSKFAAHTKLITDTSGARS